MTVPQIDFDAELARGLASYGDVLGRWWLQQSGNSVHQRAYRNVARYVHASFQHTPGLVVDYACGPGDLLVRLAWRYPHARFLGLDGSRYMLARARRRIARQGRSFSDRIQLVQTRLPDFTTTKTRADLVLYALPNIVPGPEDDGFAYAESRMTAAERHIMRRLSEQCAPDGLDPATAYATMLRDRGVSLHMRRLLKTGGACVRIEYGNLGREEMSRPQLVRAMMEEGTLDLPVDRRMPRVWFRVLASSYFRSGVIEDVRHQDGSDGPGGYLITVLRAV